ncbi:hypothetical protein [Aliiroseovarius marinus]|uniref:hypothetical protein n=1 Tax=Aliiroseovarius marinus TaxID=2500159 RepID=UPI003D7DF86C
MLDGTRADCAFMDEFSTDYDLRVAWTGACENGFAQGSGTAVVVDATRMRWYFRFEGTVVDGVMQERGYVAWPSGLFALVSFENGKMNGPGQVALKGSWGIRLMTEGIFVDNKFPDVDEENGAEMGSPAYDKWLATDVARMRRDGDSIEAREAGDDSCRGHLEEMALLAQLDWLHKGWKADAFDGKIWDLEGCRYSLEKLAAGPKQSASQREQRKQLRARAYQQVAREAKQFEVTWAEYLTPEVTDALRSAGK